MRYQIGAQRARAIENSVVKTAILRDTCVLIKLLSKNCSSKSSPGALPVQISKLRGIFSLFPSRRSGHAEVKKRFTNPLRKQNTAPARHPPSTQSLSPLQPKTLTLVSHHDILPPLPRPPSPASCPTLASASAPLPNKQAPHTCVTRSRASRAADPSGCMPSINIYETKMVAKVFCPPSEKNAPSASPAEMGGRGCSRFDVRDDVS